MRAVLPALLAISGVATGEARGAATQAASVEHASYVFDDADILDPAREAALSNRLADLERSTAYQMVVVSTVSLDGQDIAAVARKLGNAWGVGRAGIDDGVVLLVAPKERAVRIAVGRGLEATLSDADCRRIIDEEMLPRFRAGDLAAGIERGVAALIDRLT